MITNRRKNFHPGRSVVTFLMGTRRLYDFVDNNPSVEMAPVDFVNNPSVIAQNDNLVSINSCVQVDLMGQVVSSSVGLRQISGVGGQVDFVRGANMSRGGKAIIAMPSTADHGKVSKIVPLIDEGAAVTTGRCDSDYIVTEYGMARLHGKTLRDRARDLIKIACPAIPARAHRRVRKALPRPLPLSRATRAPGSAGIEFGAASGVPRSTGVPNRASPPPRAGGTTRDKTSCSRGRGAHCDRQVQRIARAAVGARSRIDGDPGGPRQSRHRRQLGGRGHHGQRPASGPGSEPRSTGRHGRRCSRDGPVPSR